MWANKEEIIWNMRDEKSVPLDNILYKYLEKFIDYRIWQKEFHKEYLKWLAGENENIYDVNFSLNSQIIDILPKLNEKLNSQNIYVFYWFDIDRSVDENFNWEFCPMTNELLTNLNIKNNNSLICKKCYLTFPKQ